MSLEKVYEYFQHYDKQTYQVVACMGNEPSRQDIKVFGKFFLPYTLSLDFSPSLSYN